MFPRISSIALVVVVAGALGACATTEETKPAAEPAAEPAAAAAPAPKLKAVANDAYEVKRGDHLWGIAAQPRIYGNPYAWPMIYKVNSAKIKDADLIYPGQNFDINRAGSTTEIDAAIRHAKTRGEWKLGVTEASDKAYLSR